MLKIFCGMINSLISGKGRKGYPSTRPKDFHRKVTNQGEKQSSSDILEIQERSEGYGPNMKMLRGKGDEGILNFPFLL